MSPIDLNAKFPELRPIQSVPSLWSVNGCGLFFHGRRDDDEETGSYIQTHCLCLVGIPILALGAYRVADADDGKYILGREPLSILARALNAMVLLAGLWLGRLLWLVGVHPDARRTSPARSWRRPTSWRPRARWPRPRRLCQEVAQGPGPSARTADAVRRVTALLDHPAARVSASEQAGVLQVAAALQRTGHWSEPPRPSMPKGRRWWIRTARPTRRGHWRSWKSSLRWPPEATT